MKTMFILSKEDIPLAVAEVLSLTKKKNYKLVDNILILDTKKSLKTLNKLALTKKILKLIKPNEIKKYYKKSICIRPNEKAPLILKHLENYKINLNDPHTKVEFHDKYCGLLLSEIKHDYTKRLTRNRPCPHPSSCNPKLARIMINLANSKSILDPFAGAGGILIEAGMMNIKYKGYDIDPIMIKRARKNLAHYKLKQNISLKDSLTLKKANCIVSDLPFGKMTKNLPKDFFDKAFKLIKNSKKAIVGVPDFISYPTPKQQFVIKLNKNLSRKILVY